MPVLRLRIIFLFLLYLLYAWLIVRPGERKLHYRSAVEGLKMYLDVAEEKQLQFFNPPTVTPQLFEELLPYAIAIDMEKPGRWMFHCHHMPHLAAGMMTELRYVG